ncbi:MAG: polysaccharide export protein [Desulfobacterales bacterium]|nr:polysaccharide export protein [Desulfobacterales bacterium]
MTRLHRLTHSAGIAAALLAAGLWALAGVGCAKKASPPPLAHGSYAAQAAETEQFNQKLFAAATLTPSRGDYLLGPGDLIEVKVFEAEKLNATVRVSSRGEVSLPLLGEVTLDGLTASEAETLIEERLKASYIKDPHVSIFVKEHNSQRVTVVGEVENPGTYDYPSRQRLLDAIALAGGLTEEAGQIAHVRRSADISNGSAQTCQINMHELIDEGRADLNIQIDGGDVIFIPKLGSFFVEGAFRRPGKYPIKDVTNINEALMAAGGLAPYASDEKLTLLRKSDAGEYINLELSLDENRQIQEKVKIQDGDIVIAESTFWGRLFHGGGVTLGVPGMGVTYRDPTR